MTRLAEIRQLRTRCIEQMRGILDAADAARRDLTPEEQARFDSYKAEVADHERRIAQREALEEVDRAAPAVQGAGGETRARTYGEQLAENPEVRAFIQSGARGKIRVQLQHEERAVTNLGSVAGSDRRPGIAALPRTKLHMRDLVPVIRTSAGSVDIVREQSFTNAAAPVIESTGAANSGVKPESDLALALLNVPAQWIAHVLTVSRQALDDMESLRTFIDTRMRAGLAETEDSQILSGDGVAPNLTGLVGLATSYQTARTQVGDGRMDVVLKALQQLIDAGVTPSAVVVNAGDYAAMLGKKDGNGQYLSQGPFGALEQPKLWGYPCVPSTKMAAGNFLAGDFARAAVLYERLAPELTISTEHADYYRRNLVLVRNESRVALGVTTPGALVTGAYGVAT